MLKRLAIATSLISLAACGGSGSNAYDGPTIVPFAASGFATEDSRVQGTETYDVQVQQRIISNDNGVLNLDRQDIVYAIASDGLSVDVTIEGETYTVDYVGDGLYAFNDGSARVQARIIRDEQVAAAISVFSVVDGQLNSSNIVIGHDTDPDTIVNLSGGAELTGQIYLEARNGYFDGYGLGDVTLDVDFDAATIGGEFDITNVDDTVSEITIPQSSYRLEETSIDGNGFSGDVTLISGDIDGTLVDATYDGRFFGSDASVAGGQVSASVVSDDFADPTYLTGAFIATE